MKTESRQWSVCLEGIDFRCLEHVMRTNGCVTYSQALRLSVERQAADRSATDSKLALQAGSILKKRQTGVSVRSWKQRFAAGDFAAMDAVVAANSFRNRSSAVRYSIRRQSQRDGMDFRKDRPKGHK